MKTKVYYRVFNEHHPMGVPCGEFSSAELAREYINNEMARYNTIENKENREYWLDYASTMGVNKIIEISEEI